MIAKLKGKCDTPWFKLMRATLMAVMAIVLVCTTATTAFAAEDHDKDFSFYRISSAASMHYDDSHNQASDNKGTFLQGAGGKISMADAGAFVGFIDENYGDGFIGSTVSFFSSSQQTRTYSSFEEAGMRQYAEYGHALKSLGLDSTANESLDIGAIVRLLSGIMLTLLYIGAVVCEQFFAFVIKVLKFTNPFALFGNAINSLGGWMAGMFGMSGDLPQVEGMYQFAGFAGLRDFVNSWYTQLYDMGFVIAVVIFAVTLGVAIMTYKSQQNKVKSVFRLFITRLAFLMIGIPLLGMTYTVTLDLAADLSDTSKNSPAANQVLMSTLVDFESWATKGKLALPANTTITVNLEGDLAGTLDMNKTTSPRDLARRINAIYSPTKVYTNDASSQDWTVDFWGRDDKGKSSVEGALDVIGRYTSSAFYHASDYETAYKKGIRESKDDNEEKVFFETIRDKTGNYEEYAKDPMSLTNDRKNIPYLANGRDDGYGTSADVDYSKTNVITFKGTATGNDSVNMGLSSLSMYNYLTTVFSDSSVETYSPMKITSKMAVHSHRSVNTVGDGVMSTLYFINMLAMFASIATIGIGYAFGLLINMFGRGIKMISSVPFSLLGNMRAMAKICTVVAMMCVEVVMTFFVYSLVVELLISLQGLIEAPMASLLSGNLSMSTMMAGGTPGIVLPIQAITAVGTLIMTVFYFVFGLKALKWRKSIVKAIDEAVAGLVDRIFTVNPNGGGMSNAAGIGARTASKPGLGEKVANVGRAAGGAMMGGAAMAAGQSILNKVGGDGSVTAGSVEESQVKDGTAENAGGADTDESADGGGQLQGAERQGLPPVSGMDDGVTPVNPKNPTGPVDGDSGVGQALLAANADSLGDVSAEQGESTRDVSVDGAQAQGGVDGAGAVEAKSTATATDTDAELSRATGQTSAMDDERDAEAKKQARAEAGKDAVKGVAKTAEGVAKGAAGYATGDAKTMAEGAKDVADGVSKTAKAGQNASEAGKSVDAARQQKVEQQKRAQAQGTSQQAQHGQSQHGQQAQAKLAKGQSQAQSSSQSPSGVPAKSSTKVEGGKSSVVNNAGAVKGNTVNVNAKQSATPAKPQGPKAQAQMNALGRRQAELKRAEKVLAKEGKVTLSNGKTVRNMSELRTMQRSAARQEQFLKDGAKHTTHIAGEAIAKSLTDNRKKDDDGFF